MDASCEDTQGQGSPVDLVLRDEKIGCGEAF